MLFRQIVEIVAGLKTETRRCEKPNERIFDGNGIRGVYSQNMRNAKYRRKWMVGSDYAVVPKRGYHGVYYDIENGWIYGHGYNPLGEANKPANIIIPLRIKILDIGESPLHDMMDTDAHAEGVKDLAEYKRLWESINKKPGTRWCDNPSVYIIRFEVLTL